MNKCSHCGKEIEIGESSNLLFFIKSKDDEENYSSSKKKRYAVVTCKSCSKAYTDNARKKGLDDDGWWNLTSLNDSENWIAQCSYFIEGLRKFEYDDESFNIILNFFKTTNNHSNNI